MTDLPFSVAEYQSRIMRVKEAMAARGVELLLITNPANINYVTGYDAWSFYTPQFVMLPIDGEPYWVGREMDAACARYTVFMPEANIIGYPDIYVQSRERHAMQFMADVVRSRGWGRRSIGVEMDSAYFTARCHAELTRDLPEADFVDADLLVNWVRLTKSETEIAYIREAGQLADLGMRAAIGTIAAGVRQCDVAAAINAAMIAGTDGFGGEQACEPVAMPMGARTSAPHLLWTDERYGAGEVTNIELAGSRRRYHCALARTLVLGPPDDRLARLADITAEGLSAAIDRARPGATCEEVEAAWRAVITKAGYEKTSRIGYSIGVAYPPEWGEQTVSFRVGDHSELGPDMCFHLICGMWLEGGGLVLSQTVRTRAGQAPEVFSAIPRELIRAG